MTALPMHIEQLERVTADGRTERLRFEPGLNIIVGRPNTGKTVWLTMLDYALGDRDPVEKALSAELAEKYSIIRAVLRLGDDAETVVERRWKEPGSKHRIYVDDHPLAADDFSAHLLPKLGIPVVHYPQGDPFSSRAWPELSWRSLFRHVFRRQDIGWGSFVERQPEGDQHACILQFLGIANAIYSDEYGNLVGLRKKRTALEARRDNYLTTLNEISRDLLAMDATAALTPGKITEALSEIDETIADLRARRNEASETTLGQISADSAALLRRKAEERAEIINVQSNAIQELREAELRLASIGDYLRKLEAEENRLQRAQVSGELFSDLRITNCPACDQPIRGSNEGAEACFLCKRILPDSSDDLGLARQRLTVGLRQLREESRESTQLRADLHERVNELQRRVRISTERLGDLQADIERARQPASAAVSDVVSQIDVELGRQEERRKQWKRIADALGRRDEISAEIRALQSQIADVDAAVGRKSAVVDLTSAADTLTDRMKDYLNLLNTFRTDAWSQPEVALWLTERQFRFTVGGDRWTSRLGGTLTLYFLLAYQYALLSLSKTVPYNYPGLTLLDMPAELPDIELTDLENFAIEPFAKLLESDRMAGCQVIVAGSAFQGLSGANKIELTHVFA